MPDQPTDKALAEVDALIAQGRKIDAIRVLREDTGWSLADAKNWVERRSGSGGAAPARETVSIERVEQLLYDGKFIEAIKAYRDAVGCDLKEARESIDAHEKALRATHPERFKSAKRSGCAGMLALALMFAAALWWAI